ncbi:hypothetical protein VTL71DRAFT_858 [Oculimacula yallundae]|uniref:CENP-V/GFA domain-containing protein n=1 Tax=Oculimacula yallundae TaxID=86028 RepID=A0ABR4D1C6_9HELO
MAESVTQAETPTQTQGSCLCGAVKFSLSGPPSLKLLCHCLSCKKVSGSLFQANSIFTTNQLTLSPSTSSEAIKTYIDTSPDSKSSVHRSFCMECGSRLWNTKPDQYPDMLVVMVGVLDLSDKEWVDWKPETEFFCKRRGGWLGDDGARGDARRGEM